MNQYIGVWGTAIALFLCALTAPAPANAILVGPGEALQADFPSLILPEDVAGVLVDFSPAAAPLTFDYQVFDGSGPLATLAGTASIDAGSVNFVEFGLPNTLLQTAVVHIILSNFTDSLNVLFVSLFDPEICEDRTDACTPLYFGEQLTVTSVPAPAVLPLFAGGLLVLGCAACLRRLRSAGTEEVSTQTGSPAL